MTPNPSTPIHKSRTSRLVAAARQWKKGRASARYPDSLFIWIPKNAGTSVYQLLRNNGLLSVGTPASVRLAFRNSGRVTFGHMSIGKLIEARLVQREFVDGAFKFAFCRDPYARAVSLYRYLCGTAMADWWEKPDFPAFLKLLADGYYDPVGLYVYRGLSQCNPQVEWLREAWPDKIYRVEEMQIFLADICERWDISAAAIPHLNRAGVDNPIELAREEKALIERIYAEDFEAFGYSFRR